MTNTTPNRAKGRHTFLAVVAVVAGLLGYGAPVVAFDLTLPGNARETARRDKSPDSHALATGRYNDGTLPLQTVQGAVSRVAWQVEAQGITTLQLLLPLKSQLIEDGFDILFECASQDCGGFDFRYRIEVFAAPGMHVDLFDFRYLTARRALDDGASEHVEILVSRTSSAGYIQVTTITPPGRKSPTATTSGASLRANNGTPSEPAQNLPIAQQLEAQGHAVLDDLTFETGSAALGAGNFASLDALATFLKNDPSRRIALVGHTDAVGSLEANIALSKRRAASVLERLVTSHGVSRAQMTAEGTGYLAPVTSNLTTEGREQNRRVEAVLLNTDK